MSEACSVTGCAAAGCATSCARMGCALAGDEEASCVLVVCEFAAGKAVPAATVVAREFVAVTAGCAAGAGYPAALGCVAGTVPAPGEPRPGKTVPSCRLALSGCEAVGAAAAVPASAVACVLFSGIAIGGCEGGGGGNGSGSALVVIVLEALCLRRKMPINPPEAAAAGAPRSCRATVWDTSIVNKILFPFAAN